MNDKDLIRLLKRLYSKKKASSKYRGLAFDLDYNKFVELSLSDCGWCGSKPSNRLKYSGLILEYNGIDRGDNSLGYTEDNELVPCCRFCNSLRGSMPIELWKNFLNAIVEVHTSYQPYPDFSGDIARSRRSYYRF